MPDGFLAGLETPLVKAPASEQPPSSEGELSSLAADRLAEEELAQQAAEHQSTDTFGQGFDAKGPEAAVLDPETEAVYIVLKDGLDAVLSTFPGREAFLQQGQTVARALAALEKKKGLRKAPAETFRLIREWLTQLASDGKNGKFWIEQEVKRRGDAIYEKLAHHQDSL